MRLQLVVCLVNLLLYVTDAELIILGAADMGGGKFWVELYATTAISDLSVYTLRTKVDYVFPSDVINAGDHIIAADDGLTDIAAFIEVPVEHLYSTSEVSLDHGDDPIYVLRGGVVEDGFGTGGPGDGDGTPWYYKFGYFRRKEGVPPTGDTFNLDDWTINTSEPLLKTCSVNSACGANAYPFQAYIAFETTTQPTTTQPTTTEPTTTEPTTTEPTTTEPTTTEPTTTEPTTTELTTTEPTTPEPTTTEPTTTEQTTTEPTTTKPTTTEPTTTEPTTTEPTTTEPTTTEPTTTEPTTTEPPTTEQTTEPTTTKPTTTEPTTTKPTTTEPTTTEPTTTKSSTTEPTTTEPTTTEPSWTEPTTTEPSSTEPTTITEQPVTQPTTEPITNKLITAQPPTRAQTPDQSTEFLTTPIRPITNDQLTSIPPTLKRPTPIPLRLSLPRPEVSGGTEEAPFAPGIGITMAVITFIFLLSVALLDIDRLYLHIKMGIGNLESRLCSGSRRTAKVGTNDCEHSPS